MKFAATLVKIFSGVLSALFFGGFLYYTYQYQLTQESSNLLIANISLVIFLISSLVFALLFITFDAYQSRNLGDLIIKSLKNTTTENKESGNNSAISDLLTHISSANSQTNQILENQLQNLSNGLNSINSATTTNSTNLQNSFAQLSDICNKISQYVDGIKTENQKANERNASQSGDFAVLVSTVSRLSSDINDLNGRLLEVVNKISQNVTTSIQSHTNIDNEIKELLQKILIARNNFSESSITPPTPAYSEPSLDLNNSSQQQTVADFYNQQTADIPQDKFVETSDIPQELTEDADIQQENEQRIDKLLSTPLDEVTNTEQPMDLTTSEQENLLEDTVADMVTNTENQQPWNEPLSEEIANTEQQFGIDEPQQPTNNLSETLLSDLPATQPAEQFNDIYSDVDSAFNAPQNQDTPQPTPAPDLSTADFSIEASDPFNPPADYLNEQNAQNDTETPISLNIPEDDSSQTETNLDSIFNDQFAAELSDLDILKDEPSANDEVEISVDDLLADTSSDKDLDK